VEDRLTASPRLWAAVAALGAIVAITASWWALALWPVDSTAPEWLLRTREVCFGSTAESLPNAGGWLLLIGQPAGMVALLIAVWGTELRAGMALAMSRAAGQVTVGVVSAVLVAGLGGVVVRVRTAGLEPFAAGPAATAAQLTRVNDAAPALALTDQTGREVTLESSRGQPVIVAFAFAHCETVCPLVVADVMTARRRLGDEAPRVLIVTLDPWRDTPSRLASIARQWGLDDEAHVLSGAPDEVERTLNGWRVPRVRNEKTGDISHPSIVYVIGADGRIAYVVSGTADAIAAAVLALSPRPPSGV
jgi:cytochrome oxidase Cu insertion factor (SCO1/SenC/PrrC family)